MRRHSDHGVPCLESLEGWWICVSPFSIHFGWVCAASLVCTNQAFVQGGTDTRAQEGLAIASLAALAMGAAGVAWVRADPLVGGVAAWANFAIGDKLSNSDGRFQQGANTYREFDVETLHQLATTAFVVAAIHTLASVLLTLRVVRRRLSTPPAVHKTAVEIGSGG